MNTITIDGQTFEVYDLSTKKGQDLWERSGFYDGYDLYSVYGRCSQVKHMIFDMWKKFANNMKRFGCDFHVVSHNTSCFTLGWSAWYLDTQVRFFITPSHNYMIMCED